MFNTLRTITEDLLKIIRGGEVTDSEQISRRQIENWVHQYRAVLLSRDLEKGYMPNPDYIQTIPNVPITGDTTLKTSGSLPRVIDLNRTSAFTFVGKTTGEEIQMIPEHRRTWQQYKRYTTAEMLWYLGSNDGKINVINPAALATLTVRGVFENPAELERFKYSSGDPVFNLDTRYPIPNNMVTTLKEMIIQKELGIETQAPGDSKNDDDHGVAQNIENQYNV